MKRFLAIILAAFSSASIILALPLSIFFGWIAGLIIQYFCGQFIADGLNLLFDTTRFMPDKICYITATLAAFSAYLRTSISIKKEE